MRLVLGPDSHRRNVARPQTWIAREAPKRLLSSQHVMIPRHKGRQPALRIVSLAPSATAILCAIGANKTLVGVTKWCADVAPVGALPKLGDCWHMGSLDEILRLKPTLVIGSVPYKQETVGKLLEQPLNF